MPRVSPIRPAPANLPRSGTEQGYVVERCDIVSLPIFFYFFHLSTAYFPLNFSVKVNANFAFKSDKNIFMKFFIDTANLTQIKEAEDLGVLDGVTTNPSLMAKEGIVGKENILKHYVDICNLVTGDVSAEVISTDFKGMVEEGERLASLHKQIVVKIPMIKDGIKALKYFSTKGIKTNCTLVFSAGQALLAAKAGATYVSPFLGRLDDINQDGIELIEQIVYIYQNYDFKTQVLAASIRSPLHIVRCAEAGADVATCPLSAILDLVKHPLTDSGLAKFLEDAKKFS